MSVDFFVGLLYGHLLVAAAVDLALRTAVHPWLVAGAMGGLLLLAATWYRAAVLATDEWAGAVRAHDQLRSVAARHCSGAHSAPGNRAGACHVDIG